MSIASTPFLFLFLPAIVVGYYLVPRKKSLQYRNLFLLVASLIFYTLGEPAFIALLLAMVFLTWCFGKMAQGKRGVGAGRAAIALTVAANLIVLLAFANFDFIVGLINQLFETNFPRAVTLPVGFSFFVFSSISYVVDIYRGQCKVSDSFLYAALYTCCFFKILQGPIISYRNFEPQLTERKESFELISDGIWRFSLGLGKKILIAEQLAIMVQGILSSDFSNLSMLDAWVGCVSFMVYLYFDFSGYTDMAIGLAELFGFSLPENFNYPYTSKSVAEFWRRFHITICIWFTEYLYYPLLLGPSVRARKLLQKHNVNDKIAKTLQNVLVPACVWFAAASWHGLSVNYVLWAMANCTFMLIERHFGQIGNERLNSALRHAGMIFFLCMSAPLISTTSFANALLLYRAMFAGPLGVSDLCLIYLQSFGCFLFVGIIGCFPVLPKMKAAFFRLAGERYQKLWDICAAILLALIVAVSLSYLFSMDTVVFLYQQ